MKQVIPKLIFIASLCLVTSELASCSQSSSKKEKAAIQMPVIKIQTVSTDADVMDFVTKTQGSTVMLAEDINGDNPFLYGDTLAYKEKTKITVIDEYGETPLEAVPADVKVRGNYTSVSDKKPLKIDFDEKQTMLELHDGKKFKKWVLLACFKDPSYLRDTIGFTLFTLLGDAYYVSDSKLVEVYINNNYWGVYLLAEQQESKRASITDAKEDGMTDTGYLFELDNYGATQSDYIAKHGTVIYDAHGHSDEVDQDFFCSGYDNTWQWYTFKSKCDEPKRSFLQRYVNLVCEICNRAVYANDFWTFNESYTSIVKDTSSKTAEECLSKIIDIDSLVNTYILSEIVCDQDLNHSSFYLSVDFGPEGNKLLTFQAPWDFDSTMGHISGDWCGDLTKDGISHLFADHYSDDPAYLGKGNVWTTLFMNAPWFQDKVIAKWKSMKKQNVLSTLVAIIDSTSNDPITVAAFERDYERWLPFDPYPRDSSMIEVLYNAKNGREHWKNQKESADILKDWLIYRFDTLDIHFDRSNPESDLYRK